MVLTVRVEVALPVIELELSEQVGAGVPPPVTAHVRATAALKPPAALRLIVEVADPPGVPMVAEVGVAVSVKPGGAAVTVNVTVAGALGGGVPVIVTVEVPTGVDPIVEIVRVSAVDDPGVTGLGLNEQVAPAGRPVQEGVTAPGDPFTAASVRAYGGAWLPATTV